MCSSSFKLFMLISSHRERFSTSATRENLRFGRNCLYAIYILNWRIFYEKIDHTEGFFFMTEKEEKSKSRRKPSNFTHIQHSSMVHNIFLWPKFIGNFLTHSMFNVDPCKKHTTFSGKDFIHLISDEAFHHHMKIVYIHCMTDFK